MCFVCKHYQFVQSSYAVTFINVLKCVHSSFVFIVTLVSCSSIHTKSLCILIYLKGSHLDFILTVFYLCEMSMTRQNLMKSYIYFVLCFSSIVN